MAAHARLKNEYEMAQMSSNDSFSDSWSKEPKNLLLLE